MSLLNGVQGALGRCVAPGQAVSVALTLAAAPAGKSSGVGPSVTGVSKAAAACVRKALAGIEWPKTPGACNVRFTASAR